LRETGKATTRKGRGSHKARLDLEISVRSFHPSSSWLPFVESSTGDLANLRLSCEPIPFVFNL
ncbi:hypothetical protein Godav_001637, partial [Gossypium davidsonii]|nr:hypothetical protein [Gossypium davidsonii]